MFILLLTIKNILTIYDLSRISLIFANSSKNGLIDSTSLKTGLSIAKDFKIFSYFAKRANSIDSFILSNYQ
jgi:hypothetical protein